jgi:hypothetical protein
VDPRIPSGKAAKFFRGIFSRDLWASIFGWRSLFRWDVLGALVPSVFLACGVGLMGIDWFPHNLLISQVCFGVCGILCVAKTIGHAVQHEGSTTTSKAVFCVLICATILGVDGYIVWSIQSHKNKLEQQATPALPLKPSLSLKAFVSLGHKKGDIVAGSAWPDDRFFDIHIVIGNIAKQPVQNIDLTVKGADSQDVFWGMGQIDDTPGVHLIKPSSPFSALTLYGKDGKRYVLDPGDPWTTQARPFGNWGISCTSLSTNQQIKLSLASIHQGDEAAPQKLVITGTYDIIFDGRIVVVPVDLTISVMH